MSTDPTRIGIFENIYQKAASMKTKYQEIQEENTNNNDSALHKMQNKHVLKFYRHYEDFLIFYHHQE